MDKKGLEFGFAWLFAIIVGAVIIFIAIFTTTNIIRAERIVSDTETAAQLGILLNPIETNLEDAKYSKITFPEETRIVNICREAGNFGKQVIKASVRSGFGEEFQEGGVENTFFNKYLFSDNVEQGKELKVIIKPFEMPYKVADLVFAYMEDYCFVNPPGDIEDELSDLNPDNIKITSDVGACGVNDKSVCFSSFSDCDINVDLKTGRVEKSGGVVSYTGSLIYGAIFASPEIYECQVKRLAKRNSQLAHLYATKADFLETKGCFTNLAESLRSFASLSLNIENSGEFVDFLVLESKEIGRRNDAKGLCKLF